jgi:hypothetical protein
LQSVLQASTSLRGAANILQIFCSVVGRLGTPTYHCGRFWLMRLGLYELQRPLCQADDWVWIVDHTVQVGSQKCFAVVGVRLSELHDWLSPELSQLSVLAIEPVEQSNADIVQQQLTEVVQRTGVPRAIVSDGCRELKRGIAQFQQCHPRTDAVYDIKHKMALIFKKALEKDQRWVAFSTAVNKTRQATLPSRLAYLAPPAPKNKGRYMNMGRLIKWTRWMVRYLEAPFPPSEGESCEIGPINIHFKWILEYQEDIEEWNRELEILETATDHCRRYGYHRATATELEPILEGTARGERSQQVAHDVLAFLEEQSALAQEGERLVATSECIESLFAKEKHIEKQQASSGFTSLLLALGACVAQPTRQVIEQAFASTTTRDVIDWAKAKLGMTVQAKRQNTLGKLKSGTETAQKTSAATT